MKNLKIVNFNTMLQDLKKRFQDIFSLISNNYDLEKQNYSNKFIFFKGNLDKVKKAAVHLSKLNLSEFNNTQEISKLGEEVGGLQKKTLENINKIETIINQQYKKLNLEQYNKEVIYRNNLDNLRLAKNFLKYINPYFEEEVKIDIVPEKIGKEVS